MEIVDAQAAERQGAAHLLPGDDAAPGVCILVAMPKKVADEPVDLLEDRWVDCKCKKDAHWLCREHMAD